MPLCRISQGIAGVLFVGQRWVFQGRFAGYCKVLQGPRGVFARSPSQGIAGFVVKSRGQGRERDYYQKCEELIP